MAIKNYKLKCSDNINTIKVSLNDETREVILEDNKGITKEIYTEADYKLFSEFIEDLANPTYEVKSHH